MLMWDVFLIFFLKNIFVKRIEIVFLSCVCFKFILILIIGGMVGNYIFIKRYIEIFF